MPMDLLNDRDRQKLYRILREMFAPLGGERFVIIAFTKDNRAFCASTHKETEPAHDLRTDLISILDSERETDFTL